MFPNIILDESIESELAEAVANLQFEDIPDDAVRPIERAFIDTVCVIFAGSKESSRKRSQALAPSLSEGDHLFSNLPNASPHQAPEQGLVLGTAAHALDYDDSSWAIHGHPSAVLVPSLLCAVPLAEDTITGEDIITAYLAGFETESCVADPIYAVHYEKGWHSTATFGTFGAVAAVANLFDFDSEETRRALNIAASMPSGVKQNFGSDTKPLHVGLAVRSGLTAALLTRDGFTSGDEAISGEQGFWDLYGEGYIEQPSVEDKWYMLRDGLIIKKYPCCRAAHSAVAVAQALRDEHNIAPEEIENVEVIAAQNARDVLRYDDPDTPLEAKFSIQYTVAAVLADGDVTLGTFDRFPDPVTEEIQEKVTFTVDSEMPYHSHTARVKISTADKTYEKETVKPWRNDDELVAVSERELKDKYMECAERALSKTEAEAIYETLNELRQNNEISTVFKTN